MTLMTRVAAVTAATLLGTALMAPVASADSFGFAASSGFATSTAPSSTGGEQGEVSYAAVGGTEDNVQVGGPFAMSIEALGSLGNFLPNPGGGGGGDDTQSGDPYGNLFAYCDGMLLVNYDNSQKTSPTEFLLTVNDVQHDTEIVPAEEQRDLVFNDIPRDAAFAIFADDVEVAASDMNDCRERSE